MARDDQKTTAIERANKGAALLDARDRDWFERVDEDDLDMEAINGCVLYRVYGSYAGGRDVLFRGAANASKEAALHGFEALAWWRTDLDDRERELLIGAEYAALDRAWRAEIRKRRVGAPNREREMAYVG